MTPREAIDALRKVQGLRFRDVRPLHGGWAHWTFEVDGEWIFRFPRNPAVAAQTVKELSLLPLLAGKVGCSVPMPVWRGTHRDRPFFGYRKILGRPLDAQDIGERPELTEELAQALRQLHFFPAEDARQATSAKGTVESWREKYERLRATARDRVGPMLDAWASQVMDERFAEFVANLHFAPALVHGDLGPEHLLVDNTGRLAGIIDWEDASVGDPAIDFAGLWRSAGAQVTRRILAAYQTTDDAPMEERVTSYAWIANVHDALHGLDVGDADLVARSIALLQGALQGTW